MKKRFIVLIDFSPYSKNLLQFADDWSQKTGAELLLFHKAVVAAPALTDSDTSTELTEITLGKARNELQYFAQDVLKGARFQSHVTDKNIILYLPKLLNDPYFDNLIFTGLKGTGMLKKLFIGSTTVHLIDQGICEVVALPRHIEQFTMDTLRVSVTPGFEFNHKAFKKILRLTDGVVRNIVFFTLLKSPDEQTASVAFLKTFADEYGSSHHTSFETKAGAEVFVALKKMMTEKHNELLVVQRGSRLLMDSIFRTFLINELVYDAETPLIVLP